MAEFLEYEDSVVNMNRATIAGEVLSVEPLKGKAVGVAFTIGYKKDWPNGKHSTERIPCYFTGTEKLEKWMWLKVGEWVVVSGEVNANGGVYAFQLEWLSKPRQTRQPGDDDPYVANMTSTELEPF